jgi:hypothetical protein
MSLLLILDEKPASESSLVKEKQAAEISALQESLNDDDDAANITVFNRIVFNNIDNQLSFDNYFVV